MVRSDDTAGRADTSFEPMEVAIGDKDFWLNLFNYVKNASIIYEDSPVFSSLTPSSAAATSSSSAAASQELPPPSSSRDAAENPDEILDLSSVFKSKSPQESTDESDGLSFLEGNNELSIIFMNWLRKNRGYISAEDLRSIKLNQSTIESASKRLGKKQLLKLILEWVEQHHIQKKRLTSKETVQITNPAVAAEPPCPVAAEPPCPVAPVNRVVMGIPIQPWGVSPYYPVAQFSCCRDNGNVVSAPRLNGNPYRNFDPNDKRMVRLGSSTAKEARKRRMMENERRKRM